ncbi:unnamed protein product [Urochloa decumbens]|uniref:Uncharacterized protein n=1 Tax=Urochloa decumbens TaxID=240449 RepID=A0ABC9DLE3_9POAL
MAGAEFRSAVRAIFWANLILAGFVATTRPELLLQLPNLKDAPPSTTCAPPPVESYLAACFLHTASFSWPCAEPPFSPSTSGASPSAGEAEAACCPRTRRCRCASGSSSSSPSPTWRPSRCSSAGTAASFSCSRWACSGVSPARSRASSSRPAPPPELRSSTFSLPSPCVASAPGRVGDARPAASPRDASSLHQATVSTLLVRVCVC